jgi:uncharacterized protein YbjQ (UPF0145 family)
MAELIVFLVLLVVGYAFGRRAERAHYASILEREERLRGLLLIQTRFPPAIEPPPATTLVGGSVVISVDFFKVFVAGLRSLIGGRLTSYEGLADRARREAVLRMKQEARAKGATMIMNVTFETVPMYKGQRGTVQSIEAFAYGTALIPAR